MWCQLYNISQYILYHDTSWRYTGQKKSVLNLVVERRSSKLLLHLSYLDKLEYEMPTDNIRVPKKKTKTNIFGFQLRINFSVS